MIYIFVAEGLKDFFKSVGKATVNFGKKGANNPVRALEIASKILSAAASRNPRAALSATPDLIKFSTTDDKSGYSNLSLSAVGLVMDSVRKFFLFLSLYLFV